MRAFGVFQGGGAKGYAHLGALSAAEDRGIEFERVAGTSAGAIVASLVACGYTSQELYEPVGEFGDRGVLDVQPFDVLGEAYRQEIGFARAEMDEIVKAARKKRPLGKLRLLARGILASIRFRGLLTNLRRDYGILPTQGLERWLDGLYRSKLGIDRTVVFDDLCIPLKVITADVASGHMKVIGEAEHSSIEVAKSVTASACFPLVFQPVDVMDGRNVDGGLVSNLPAWIFDAERNAQTEFLPTFGFRLASDLLTPMPDPPKNVFSFVWQMVQTMQAGTRTLEERRIDDYHAIDLVADIGTLDLDEIAERAPQLISVGRRCVEEYFNSRLGPRDPIHMSKVLKVVLAALDRRYGWLGYRSRASILLAEPDGLHARIAYSARMEGDADDRLRVRLDGTGVGASFFLREPVYIDLNLRDQQHFGLDKYEFGMRPHDIRRFYSIPIFLNAKEWLKERPEDRPVPEACLVVDLAEDFAGALADPVEQDLFAITSALVGEEIRSIRILEESSHGSKPVSIEGPAWSQTGPHSLCRVSTRKIRSIRADHFGSSLIASLRRLSEVH